LSAIRFAAPGDAEQIASIYAPFVLHTPVSFEETPPDADEIRARMARLRGRWPWLVAADADRVLGYAYASEHRARPAYRWAVDTTVYVDEHARRGGIGRSLYRELLRILTRQGFCAAYAGIALPNDASVGLHTAVGFEFVAVYPAVGFKLGRWHDVSWWRRALNEPSGLPVDPAPLEGIPPSGD
jgi:phosphinothricin acetyltransferase